MLFDLEIGLQNKNLLLHMVYTLIIPLKRAIWLSKLIPIPLS